MSQQKQGGGQKKSKNKTVTTKPLLLVRVKCAGKDKDGKEHENPWLRRLYVIWAAAGPDGKRATPFHLGQTDQNGWLSAPKTDLDPSPEGVVPLVANLTYLC